MQTGEGPRVVVIGDSTVGKTALVDTFLLHGSAHESEERRAATLPPTEDITMRETTLVENPSVAVTIAETPGREAFLDQRPHFLDLADAVVLVFDCNNRVSYNSLTKTWLPLIQQSGKTRPVFVACNKVDLNEQAKAHPFKFAGDNNFPLVHTSAVTGEGVQELFRAATAVAASEWTKSQPSGVDEEAVRLAALPAPLGWKRVKADPPRDRKPLKIVLVGDSYVGKTAIAKWASSGEFSHAQSSTEGATIYPFDLEPAEGSDVAQQQRVDIDIWDLPGQERFDGIRPGMYARADAVILAFNCTRKVSYKNLKDRWLPEALNACRNGIPIIVTCAMVDEDATAKSREFAFAKDNGFPLFYTSAATGEGITEMMDAARIAAQSDWYKPPPSAEEIEEARLAALPTPPGWKRVEADPSRERRPLKVVLAGDSAVGKTKIATRASNGTFSPEQRSSDEAAIFPFDLEPAQEGGASSSSSSRFEVDIWDLPGMERYDATRPQMYAGADAVILVFDCLRKITYVDLKKKWLPEVQNACRAGTPILVACAKVDLEPKATTIEYAFAKDYGFPLFCVSAAENRDIAALIWAAAEAGADMAVARGEAPAATVIPSAAAQEVTSPVEGKPLRIAVVGDSASGKTKLVERFAENVFHVECSSTKALQTTTRTITTAAGVAHSVEILDVPGAEVFANLRLSSLANIDAAILVFDCMRKPTYMNLKNVWLQEVIQANPGRVVPMLVACAKSDIDIHIREKQFKFAGENGFPLHYVSAADGTGVKELFQGAAAAAAGLP